MRIRKTWAAALAALAGVAALAGIAVAPAASAAPAKPAPNTCTFAHSFLGHFIAIDSFTHHKLAWTASHNTPGSPVTLEPYRNRTNQCWKFLGGFGGGRDEIQLLKGLCITENTITRDSGVPMMLESCLSKKTQQFTEVGVPGVRLRLAQTPKLCVASDINAAAGAVLYQVNCSGSQRQHWTVNTSP
jgi:hypothetical protein